MQNQTAEELAQITGKLLIDFPEKITEKMNQLNILEKQIFELDIKLQVKSKILTQKVE